MSDVSTAKPDTHVLIVGAGPIGLELAVVLKAMGIACTHIDAGQIGHTISSYPPQATFFSSPDRIAIAGVPLTTPDQNKASREQYLAYLRAIVDQFDLHVNTFERLIDLTRNGDSHWSAVTEPANGKRKQYRATHVVLAIGDMHAPRLLNIPGEDLPHVSHYFGDPHQYFRKQLLIVGGKNSAAEAALRCHRAGAQVAISYRREAFNESSIKYWLLPELKSLIKSGQIAFRPKTVPTAIEPGCVQLAPTDAQGAPTGDMPTHVDADFVLLLTGYVQDKSLFEKAGITLQGDNRAPTFDQVTMLTDAPNVYVAGTAAAGTQASFKLFIENCHVHAERIAGAITGRDVPPGLINDVGKQVELPES